MTSADVIGAAPTELLSEVAPQSRSSSRPELSPIEW